MKHVEGVKQKILIPGTQYTISYGVDGEAADHHGCQPAEVIYFPVQAMHPIARVMVKW